MSTTQPTAAVCQIDDCGVQAIGRCKTCGRAFCSTHQARTAGVPSVAYVDMCSPCFAQSPAEVERVKQQQRNAEISVAQLYFEGGKYNKPGSARMELRASNVPSVDIWRVTGQQYERGVLGIGSRYVDVVARGRGWIIGEFRWKAGTWLTALLDLSHEDLTYRYWAGLARVTPRDEGYDAVSFPNQADQIQDWDELIKVAKAAKQLMEASS